MPRRKKTASGQGGYEFDMRTSRGKKANSQGTLFQVTQYPRDRAPMHRGYSPARMDEVRQKIRVNADDLWNDVTSQDNRMEPSGNGWRRLSQVEVGFRNQARRMVEEEIARSTAPIIGPHAVTIVNRSHKGARASSHAIRRGTAAGTFSPGDGHVFVSDRFFLPDDSSYARTLFHELGHAHDWDSGRLPGSTRRFRYGTPEEQGVAEAYADDFSVRHTPGRGPMYRGEYGRGKREEEFRSAYLGARTEPMNYVEAQTRPLVSPSLPGSGNFPKSREDVVAEVQAFHRDNPTLPGMEDMYTSLHPAYETPGQYAERVNRRQDEALR